MKTYTWEQINLALSLRGYSPAQILRIMSELNHVKREDLVMDKKEVKRVRTIKARLDYDNEQQGWAG